MTVSTTNNRVSTAGNGVTTAFSFPNKFIANADLVVLLVTDATAVSVTQALTTNYTVTGAGVSGGGTVTMLVAPAVGETLVIYDDPAITQGSTLVDNDRLPAGTLNDMVDKLTIICQRLSSRITRSLTFSDADTTTASATLPTPVASTFLGWNSAGTALENTAVGSVALATPGDGSVTAAKIASGAVTAIKLASSALGFSLINGTLVASVASSALTIAIKTKAGTDPSVTDPVDIIFRNTTSATGDYTLIQLTAATSFVISSGSTMGATNSTPFRLWLVGFNDAGTFRMGAVNCLSVTNILALRDDILASSTAEGGAGAADSAQVIYTGTAVAAKPMRVLGFIEYSAGLAAVGTYGIVPTKVQHFGPGVSLPGSVVQSIRNDQGVLGAASTVIPGDDTIPQNTEGDQYMSTSITPTSTANLLEITAQGFYSNSSAGAAATVQALFQDAIANALKASWVNYSIGYIVCILTKHIMQAGTIAATTFKVRAGSVVAGTTTFNGTASARLMGGVMNSYTEIREIAA